MNYKMNHQRRKISLFGEELCRDANKYRIHKVFDRRRQHKNTFWRRTKPKYKKLVPPSYSRPGITEKTLPKSVLHNAMFEALIQNRVDLVCRLLENGVNMDEFLTIGRLEELYNTDQGPPNTLYYIVRDVVKIKQGYRYRLPHIGMSIEKLMANGFRSYYTSPAFRKKYNEYRSKLNAKNDSSLSPVNVDHVNGLKEHQSSPSPDDFFTAGGPAGGIRGTGFRRSFPRISPPSTSAAGSSRHRNHSSILPPPTTTNLPISASRNNPTNQRRRLDVIPQTSSSRALSNHILWRSACRMMDPQHLLGTGIANMPTSSAAQQSKNSSLDNIEEDEEQQNERTIEPAFKYPFSDLLVWAVLTKRQEMALCMWRNGEEALAKALVACRLYKSLSKEAAEDYLEVEVCDELRKYALEFQRLALELLDRCYKQDDAKTLQLLTYELCFWGQETCLSLAVIVNHKQFLAHPCCQILLADLWHGGLRIRSNSNLKVIMGILFPPSIFLLEFKSREELMLQPQTAAEHQDDILSSSSSSSSESSSSSSDMSEDEDDGVGLKQQQNVVGRDGIDRSMPSPFDRRRISPSRSSTSLHLGSIFQSKKRKRRKRLMTDDLEMARRDFSSENSNKIFTTSNQQRTGGIYQPSGSAGGGLENGTTECVILQERPRRPHQPPLLAATSSALGQLVFGTTDAAVTPITAAPVPITPPPHPQSLPNPLSHLSPQNKDNNCFSGETHATSDAAAAPPPTRVTASTDTFEQTPTTTTANILPGSSLSVGHFPPYNKSMAVVTQGINKSNGGGLKQASSSPSNSKPFHCSLPLAMDDKDSASNATDSPSPKRPDQCFLRHSSESSKQRTSMRSKSKSINSLNRKNKFQASVPLPEGTAYIKRKQIKFKRKLYEFFVAPITTFWAWTLSFVVFLSALTYVLLIRTPTKPTLLEWYLLAYVIAIGLEILRKFFISEPKKMKEKFEHFYGNYWNLLSTAAVVIFIVGFAFRINPSTKPTGRIVLAIGSVLWSLKLLDFLSVHARFGPYITMAGKMVMNMSSIVIMLWIALLSFGLARQSITYPNEDWHWLLLRNVFYKPYFMLYGEVYADEIDSCGDEAWDKHLEDHVPIDATWNNTDKPNLCVPGHWIPPILMTIFLLIANILLISMLIAIFNNIFESTNKISQQIWLFQRYRQVMEYEATPFIPPPFTPIYHIYILIKYICYRRLHFGGCHCACVDKAKSIGTTLKICACCAQKSSETAPSSPSRNRQTLAIQNSLGSPPRSTDPTNDKPERISAFFDFSLKLFLTDDQIEKLHIFEAECMEDLANAKEYEKSRTNDELILRTNERTELIVHRLNQVINSKRVTSHPADDVRDLEIRLTSLENKQAEILECIQQINSTLPAVLNFLQQSQFPIVSFKEKVEILVDVPKSSSAPSASPASRIFFLGDGDSRGCPHSSGE